MNCLLYNYSIFNQPLLKREDKIRSFVFIVLLYAFINFSYYLGVFVALVFIYFLRKKTHIIETLQA